MLVLIYLIYAIYKNYPLKNHMSNDSKDSLFIDYLTYCFQTTGILSVSMEIGSSIFYYIKFLPILTNPQVVDLIYFIFYE